MSWQATNAITNASVSHQFSPWSWCSAASDYDIETFWKEMRTYSSGIMNDTSLIKARGRRAIWNLLDSFVLGTDSYLIKRCWKTRPDTRQSHWMWGRVGAAFQYPFGKRQKRSSLPPDQRTSKATDRRTNRVRCSQLFTVSVFLLRKTFCHCCKNMRFWVGVSHWRWQWCEPCLSQLHLLSGQCSKTM